MQTNFPAASLAGRSINISAFGRNWILDRATNLEELWEAMDSEDFADERIPYWTELWPASLVLARWLFEQRERIRDRICLDLGCGLGFTALLGEWLGAKMLACDYELEPLLHGRRSAELNDIPQPGWLCLDWRQPALAAASLDYIWAGDIFYEKRAVDPVLDFFSQTLSAEGRAWIAEPGRGVFAFFQERAQARGWQLAKVFSGSAKSPYPGDIRIRVAIWEVSHR